MSRDTGIHEDVSIKPSTAKMPMGGRIGGGGFLEVNPPGSLLVLLDFSHCFSYELGRVDTERITPKSFVFLQGTIAKSKQVSTIAASKNAFNTSS